MDKTKVDNWKQLRYGLGALKAMLESVNHTTEDVLSDLEMPDDRFKIVFDDFRKDINHWIKEMDNNMHYCKGQESK